MSIQEQYRKKAAELLSSGDVKLVIGYGAGTNPDRRRPLFIRSAEAASNLLIDADCDANLSGYLVNEGLLSDKKKVGIFLAPEGIRSVNILASESQLDPDQIVIFGFERDGGSIAALEGSNVRDYTDRIATLKSMPPDAEEQARIDMIENMSAEERFAFWQAEFSKCIKCYACRQVCPMCYCKRCIVDNNQPQWVHTSSHTLGNFEWNLVRAFHLSGRCVECGGCDRACPVNIPLRLINRKMAAEVLDAFDHFSGMSPDQETVLANFRKDDPETFIL
ncbi:MAG: 4Fe-4S dicluster domain-containing protein [Chlorobium sp.]|uniref:4Fe-4S dicluster domain-containing protein n=1 Tax=Chlorobium sp. TaxID=1095 RepID=UPI0025BCA216|nr:4Fe-4S dicluster domain-containing protein [Chlorobium sp.]MCF8215952.1 4Fe-4S dicluster domain-containing protein [Chlorobium sp.]MCF8270461.1 4Fe-4S dicluster domain-containing protein [Chlorobium sp.]MCF8287227.1 4Fe-4S dicluster domain-containing protein [Chlorobium sp.]MCF8290429.1 4Fe-4S dicluster domain-containing protein [Chlorobium sp.]MCF8384663.1 4Fe-4S dicluster domain-containing protein [Chlorobium sp.]